MGKKILLNWTRLLVLVMTIGLSGMISQESWGQVVQPTVTTDKLDYAPGEYVIITGTGWEPGERVDFHFEETPKPETCVNSHDNFAIADANGDIYYDGFLIKDNHLGVAFVLTATGQISESIAQTEFTDGVVFPSGISTASEDQELCPNGTASPLIATISTCEVSGGGSATNYRDITYTWYYNITNTNEISAATQIAQTTNTTAATTSNSFTPPTDFNGTRYYFSRVSYVPNPGGGVGNTCGRVSAEGYPFTTETIAVTVEDTTAPVVDAVTEITVTLDASGAGSLAVADVLNNASTDACGIASEVLSQTSFGCGDVGTFEITLTVTDVNGNETEKTISVTVVNDSPENIIISAPIVPQSIGTSITVNATFEDENIKSATWTAFDGNTSIQSVTIPATGKLSSYTFTNLPAGVYTIILELEDHCGLTATQEFQFVTIYDPNGGFVTGGGWIYSKPGDLVTNPAAEGKANFGFVAKYKTGKNQIDQVEGNTNFQFKEGDFHFKSTSHENMSLVISGAKATYRGVGTVNGIGSHKFMVTVIDGDLRGTTDKFRIRVWANGSSSDVIYDNEYNLAENAEAITGIGGGSIVIHKPAAKGNKRVSTELMTVAWNTPVETIKKEVDQLSLTWFESRKLPMTLDANNYDPLTPGFYELKVDLMENEFFALDEPISIQVLVQDKPKALDILVDNSKLTKELRVGDVLGILRTIDPVDNIHTYGIGDHPDLTLDGDKLIWKGTTVPAQLKLTVYSTDRAGQTISREISLSRELKPGEFFLYPNPAQRETNVMVDLDREATVAIRIYDAVGRMVVENETYREGSFTQTFNLDGLAAGFYTVQVKVGDMVMTKRLIKK